MLVYYFASSLVVAYVVYRKYTINLPDAVTMGGAYDGGLTSPVGLLPVEHSRLLRGTMQCVWWYFVSSSHGRRQLPHPLCPDSFQHLPQTSPSQL